MKRYLKMNEIQQNYRGNENNLCYEVSSTAEPRRVELAPRVILREEQGESSSMGTWGSMEEGDEEKDKSGPKSNDSVVFLESVGRKKDLLESDL